MQQNSYYILNGKMCNSNVASISIDNRSFRYGDGFFETIKLVNNEIQLKHLHFDRITKSLAILKFQLSKHFLFDNLEKQIQQVAQKNNHTKLGRVRITFFRNNGGLYDEISNEPNIAIQTFTLSNSFNQLNENGLVIDVYEDAKKSCDAFSNIKSNNFLPYTMAALWAKENKLNDAIILNSNNCIADSTIANVFMIKNGTIKTPSLNNACIDGVMRKNIIHQLNAQNISVAETSLSIDDLLQADEIFLTNAIKGISWVKQFKKHTYTCNVIQKIAANIKIN